ncbi:Hypothetical predicted protein, partial [Podarcis lilfordi]
MQAALRETTPVGRFLPARKNAQAKKGDLFGSGASRCYGFPLGAEPLGRLRNGFAELQCHFEIANQ